MSATVTTPVRPSSATFAAQTLPIPAPRRRWWLVLLNGIPNLVVFSLLAGVMYVGHHTGWRLPTMGALRGVAAVQPVDWCPEHLVPESQCIECKPELYPKPQPTGFCHEHGVAECVIHHPELAQIQGDVQLPKYDTVRAIALLDRPTNNSRNTLHTSRVQFTSIESVNRAGIDVDVVQERRMSDVVTANGELGFDPTRVAHLSSRAPGTVAAVFKMLGEQVQAGETLALVDAAQVGEAKAKLLQAVVDFQLQSTNVSRLRSVASSGAVSGKLLIDAESALKTTEVTLLSARQALGNLGLEVPSGLEVKSPQEISDQLQFLGIPPELIAALPSGRTTATLIPIRAPFSGVVVDSQVVASEVVNSADRLFTVADPQQLWLLLSVRQEDARHVTLDLPVEFLPDDGSGAITGKVSWISPAIEEQTRTLKVRVPVSNPEGRLRDMTFGTGRIVLRDEPHAIVVPRAAVLSTNDAHFVFVRDKNYFNKDAPKVFHVRQVRIGARDDQFTELLAGVLPGEVVATTGSPVLLAQLLRSSLGAGCGCHQD